MSLPHDDEEHLRQQVVEICRRLHDAGFIAGSDGNVSVRLGARTVLATPTGTAKGWLRPGELVKTDLEGQPLGRGRPSSELRLHLLAYRSRPDVRAVIHSHAPHAVALSLAGVPLAGCLLPETVLGLGAVPTAPYATPTTEEVPESVRHLLDCNALILARHGILTLGVDLHQAWLRQESVEHAAKVTALARAIGPVQPLPPERMVRLEQIAEALGVPLGPHRCSSCGTCRPAAPRTTPSLAERAATGAAHEAMLEALVGQVLRRLTAG